ncbi:MAG: Vi polysaccharide biosynthesis protein VipB/TviC [Omnitrophica bacterium RIFCSPHIGHO2_02_FULL_46_11]|nr:MAG: Vi polysaccharide biosynthesis protein VipB/TviC [Omnitrophica bacterium RIFCSPLOWO2_01_FULL_45_10b]OGW86890.1 MAG: Vi polysaccharide biosynthesis protein VipB/TviC [Omnitrophica bacterium RIFCSPHIGHO2_02_FULL_46_11]
MARCLVTGGAGFIGSHIVDALVAQGDEVRVFDNLSTGKKENLSQLESKVELVVGDLRDKTALEQALNGIDYVFHVAALRAVLRSVDDPQETNDVNVTGTLNLLLAARDARVKRVVFSSSSSVYGDTEKFPCEETDKPKPQSPYAASKIMGEYFCQIFTRLYGLETVSLRYFNVFGPRQNPESVYSAVIPIFVDRLLLGVSPEIHWDGKQSRDFSYVDNVVQGNLLAAQAKGAAGEVVNIACHQEFSVLDIFENLKDILNIHDIHPVFKPKRAGDVRRTFADISKAEKLLGFKVQTRFRPGLENTVKWFLESGILASTWDASSDRK